MISSEKYQNVTENAFQRREREEREERLTNMQLSDTFGGAK